MTDEPRAGGLAGVYRSWPRWARIAAPVSAAILLLGIVGAVTGEPEEGDRALVEESDASTTTERPSTTSTTVRATTSTTTASTTTAPPTTAVPTTAPPPPPPTTAPPPPPPPTVAPPPAPEPSTSYANCSEAKAAGVTPLYRGDPGYASHLDRDNDGVACES